MLSKKNRSTIILSIGILLLAGVAISLWAYDAWHRDKIIYGVSLGGLPMGGYSPDYARDILEQYEERLRAQGVRFTYRGKSATLYPRLIPFGSDIPLQASEILFDLNVEKTVANLNAVGRTGSLVLQQRDRLGALFRGYRVSPSLTLNERAIIKELQREFSFFHTPPTDARFALDEGGVLVVAPSRRGMEFDYDAAFADLRSQITALKHSAIALNEGSRAPTIIEDDLVQLKPAVERLLSRLPLILTLPHDDKQSWHIPSALAIDWFTPRKQSALSLGYDQEKINAFLKETVAPDVFIEVVHPRFEMNNGRVTAFALAKNGRELDNAATADAIIAALQGSESRVPIIVRETTSPYTTIADSAPRITSLLARSETNFSGSPKNRRANIARGAALINGILLAPGEPFSTVKSLGTIDDTNGFLPELVIKGDKTTPEFGGGLCQVSTTLFRAVSFAGLEILERRNHSYRVSYYEPPVGFDATIYDPAPDFKFKNDTNNHVLVQSRVSGDSMIVEIWGVHDGRAVEIDKPRVFNIKKPTEPKIIETDELPPGEKKRIERAHNGADAVFERRIVYADGTTKKETYKSHYVVWPEVWLVGRENPEMQEGVIPSPESESARSE